ncbi:SDR family NAD(P)-dependent oxidoreductase [Nocardioides acrostichi]|uniref:SDR family oxidoreductase n=1 Tax=Nocardioides acrostichi TaxID=2784339 RepID=A0A930V0N4_9ACTN|nr:SDR family oxidoreductase [Nocardioides acrostichi]MBF4161686.1 SDR family oxidoreductase [Nocardioides acrostichi]
MSASSSSPGHSPGRSYGRSSSRSVVVTGAARGIGRGIAALLVRQGWSVVLTDVDGAAVARTADEVGGVAGLAHDVRDPRAHEHAAEVAGSHAPLRAWVNNAGVGDDGRLAELTEEQVRHLVEVNVLGVLWGMRTAQAGFERTSGEPRGDIVNVASLSGLGPVPGYSVYAATKAAVVSLSMSVDAETPRGLRVHALCPDGVQTPMLAATDPHGLGAALVHSGGRILGVEEVAERAVDLIGSGRVVRTLPAWRGALLRGTALAPGLAARGTAAFAAQGRRAMKRSGG